MKSWASGRNRAAPGAVAELRDIYARIERAAAETVALVARQPAEAEIEFGLAADDAEAQALGWPCVGAHAALLGLVAARLRRPVTIAPRGSTSGTAAAADAHGR